MSADTRRTSRTTPEAVVQHPRPHSASTSPQPCAPPRPHHHHRHTRPSLQHAPDPAPAPAPARLSPTASHLPPPQPLPQPPFCRRLVRRARPACVQRHGGRRAVARPARDLPAAQRRPQPAHHAVTLPGQERHQRGRHGGVRQPRGAVQVGQVSYGVLRCEVWHCCKGKQSL